MLYALQECVGGLQKHKHLLEAANAALRQKNYKLHQDLSSHQEQSKQVLGTHFSNESNGNNKKSTEVLALVAIVQKNSNIVNTYREQLLLWNIISTYTRRQYKVSVTCHLPTVPYLRKTPLKRLAMTVPFYSAGRGAILLLRSKYKVESSSMWIFLVCLPLLFFPPVSYSAAPLQSINCFCSSRRLIASLLASFAQVRRRYCSCSFSRPFRFSPSIVSALLVD